MLKEKIKRFLSPDYKVIFNGGAYIFDKGIVKKVFPNLCSQINEGLINLKELNPIAPGVYKFDMFFTSVSYGFNVHCFAYDSFLVGVF